MTLMRSEVRVLSGPPITPLESGDFYFYTTVMSSMSIPPFTTLPPASFEVPDVHVTARLFTADDAANLLTLAVAPAVKLYVPWAKRVDDLESASSAIIEFNNAWKNQIMARYALEKDGGFIGYCGVWTDQKPDYYEFGFALLPEVRGRGIGTAVIAELIRIAKENMNAKGVIAYVDDTNGASKTVITKLGLVPTEEFDQGDRRYELHF